jgi:hypothetical protein
VHESSTPIFKAGELPQTVATKLAAATPISL